MVRAWIVLALCVSGSAQAQPLERFAFQRSLMGSDVRIVLYAPSAPQASRAADSAFERIDKLESKLSDWRSDSELSRLSAMEDTVGHVSRELWDVLLVAQRVAEASNGAFDVTVGPLSRLWRWSMRRGILPAQDELISARSRVGYRFMQLDSARQAVWLTKPGMRLDLGGIGKGYAADVALALLDSLGYTHALVDAGGDMAIGAAPPGTEGWHIKVDSVGGEGMRIEHEVILQKCGVAASGATYRYLEHEDVRYSHIVNPATGLGVTHERIVTVVAGSGMLADAWASAFSVMDAEDALRHASASDSLAVRIVQRKGGRYVMRMAGEWGFARGNHLY